MIKISKSDGVVYCIIEKSVTIDTDLHFKLLIFIFVLGCLIRNIVLFYNIQCWEFVGCEEVIQVLYNDGVYGVKLFFALHYRLLGFVSGTEYFSAGEIWKDDIEFVFIY
jgi:hypothetical protein